MWVYVLFLTVIYFVPDDPDVHVRVQALHVATTEKECTTLLREVKQSMEESYPEDKDYILTCERKERPQ